MHVRQVRPGDRETDGLRARRQEQSAIADPTSVVERNGLLRGIDLGDAGVQSDLDPVRAVERLRTQGNPIGLGVSGQIVLRQIGSIAGQGRVGAEQGDGPLIALAPQGFGRRIARCPAADDHHRLRKHRRGRPGRFRFGLGRAHEGLAVALFDGPALQVVQRRRADGLAGPQAEAGVVPRAAHRVADQQALGQGAAVVGAVRRHREQLLALAHEQHGFAVHLALQHGPVGEIGQGHALGEIGPGRL